MKKIACLILVAIVGLLGALMLSAMSAKPVYAAGDCEHTILGLRPWYSGLDTGDKCAIESPSEDEIPKFVWTIILNILADVFLIGGYLGVGFVIYGGFLYMMSAGDPGKTAKGKRVLVSAVIGLVIMILATVIVNFVISVLTEAAS